MKQIEAADSWASNPGVRSRMMRQRSRDTGLEMSVRRALHARGLRYRIHRRLIPGTTRTVDVAFGPAKVAVDIRGCYWHGHEHEMMAYHRKTHQEYWSSKIERNRLRDADTFQRLTDLGWVVVVVWGCEDVEAAADAIAPLVRARAPRRCSATSV